MQAIRRDPRAPAQLEIQLNRGRWIPYLTLNVSRRGLFVCAVDEIQLLRLVQLRIWIDDSSEPLGLIACVVRQLPLWPALTQRRKPGFGLELYRLGGEAGEAWERFVQSALEAEASASATGERLQELEVTLEDADEG